MGTDALSQVGDDFSTPRPDAACRPAARLRSVSTNTTSPKAADQRLRVLISSSAGELPAERDAARAAVGTLRLTPVLHEPGASEDALSADVFVGVYGETYGWVSP